MNHEEAAAKAKEIINFWEKPTRSPTTDDCLYAVACLTVLLEAYEAAVKDIEFLISQGNLVSCRMCDKYETKSCGKAHKCEPKWRGPAPGREKE